MLSYTNAGKKPVCFAGTELKKRQAGLIDSTCSSKINSESDREIRSRIILGNQKIATAVATATATAKAKEQQTAERYV